jgi:hypothetical protein
MPGDKVENLLVPKPLRRLAMHFEGRRFKQQAVAPVFQGGHIRVERFPFVADDDHVTGRRKAALGRKL